MSFALNINGEPHTLYVDGDMPLLWVLRDILKLTGTKYGCGVARCGACTVHVDGLPVRACAFPVARAVGRDVTTIECVSVLKPKQSERLGSRAMLHSAAIANQAKS